MASMRQAGQSPLESGSMLLLVLLQRKEDLMIVLQERKTLTGGIGLVANEGGSNDLNAGRKGAIYAVSTVCG